MKIEHLKNNEIDKTRWNKIIENSYNGIFYGCSWFLDVMTDKCWEALVINDYEYILPLPFKKMLFLKGINRPFFMQINNIYGIKPPSLYLIEAVLKFLRNKYFSINLYFSNTELLNISGYNFEYLQTQRLKLNCDFNVLENSFDKQHKKNIKKAKNKNVIVKQSNNLSSTISMIKKVFEIKRMDYPNKEYERLKLIIRYNIENFKGEVYDAFLGDELIASAFFCKFNSTYTIFSGNSLKARKNGAAYLIINEFLKNHSNENAELDFAGSNIKGVKDWNMGFGSENLNYLHIYKKNILLQTINNINKK